MNTTHSSEETGQFGMLPVYGRASLFPLAYWASQIGSPPVTAVAALLLCSYTAGLRATGALTFTYALVAIFMPLLYIVWLYKRGDIGDLHMNRRQDRIKPSITLIISAGLGWLLLRQQAAPPIFLILGMAVALQSVFTLVITLFWKISVHSLSAANLATIGVLLVGMTAVPLVLLIFLIAWSRLYLGRHTPLQTIIGALMGTVLPLCSAIFIYNHW